MRANSHLLLVHCVPQSLHRRLSALRHAREEAVSDVYHTDAWILARLALMVLLNCLLLTSSSTLHALSELKPFASVMTSMCGTTQLADQVRGQRLRGCGVA